MFGKKTTLEQIEKMNRTQDFMVFKQGFSASKFPRYYKPNDNLSSGKGSPRNQNSNRTNLPENKNSMNFKFALDSKRE